MIAAADEAPRRPYVLGAGEGEQLIHFRDQGRVVIAAGAATGSSQLAMGTQQVKRGTGIPLHRHPQADEAFYIQDGSGIVTLNDEHKPVQGGAWIFIPRGTWHAFSNPEHELHLLWMVSPAGLDGFFRETCSAPGAPPKNWTKSQIKEIALRHGTEFR